MQLHQVPKACRRGPACTLPRRRDTVLLAGPQHGRAGANPHANPSRSCVVDAVCGTDDAPADGSDLIRCLSRCSCPGCQNPNGALALFFSSRSRPTTLWGVALSCGARRGALRLHNTPSPTAPAPAALSGPPHSYARHTHTAKHWNAAHRTHHHHLGVSALCVSRRPPPAGRGCRCEGRPPPALSAP